MAGWFETDWGKMFALHMSLPEIFVRGTIAYLGAVILLRIVPRRQAGKLSLSDLLVVTIIAGVVRNPIIGSDDSVLDGLLCIGLVLFWSFVLDWLCYRIGIVRRFMHPKPVVVVRHGRVQDESLANELMTRDQLKAQLRHCGVRSFAEVEEARIESDGKITVVPRDPPPARKGRRNRRHSA